MMGILQTVLLALIMGLLATTPAWAHKPSDSYLKLSGGDEQLSIQWDIAIKDLEFLIGLDSDQNGDITWGELKASESTIAAHALSRLSILANDQRYQLELSRMLVTQHSDGAYVVLELRSDCPGDATHLNVAYDLLFDVDPTHRGLVLYDNLGHTSTHILSPDSPTVDIHAGERTLGATFLDYVREGIWHIWIGFDHILFLLTLLLPAVYRRRDETWQPVDAFKPAWVSVLKIVTMFTLAHSITLWLAVMEYVTLPSQLVEATIAFSIVLTAMNNLFPVLPLSSRTIAFVFGLIHGFGFANVLLDLGLSSVTLGVSLLGFNVGVEVGQIAIVSVFLPLAILLKTTSFYRRCVFQAGSAIIAGVAVLWVYERVFNAEILGF